MCWRPVYWVRGAGLGTDIKPTDTRGIHEHECACKSREWRGGGGLSSQTNSNPDQPEGRNRAGLSVFLSLRFTWVLVVASECCWGQIDGGSSVRVLCACARLSGVHRASLLVKSAKTNSSVYAHGNGTETPRGGSACTCWVWVAGKEEFLGPESTWGSSVPTASFNNHHGVCELSCCSSADLSIAASPRWGGTRPPEIIQAKPPAQSRSSWGRQGLPQRRSAWWSVRCCPRSSRRVTDTWGAKQLWVGAAGTQAAEVASRRWAAPYETGALLFRFCSMFDCVVLQKLWCDCLLTRAALLGAVGSCMQWGSKPACHQTHKGLGQLVCGQKPLP